jgi:hypothetical protein
MFPGANAIASLASTGTRGAAGGVFFFVFTFDDPTQDKTGHVDDELNAETLHDVQNLFHFTTGKPGAPQDSFSQLGGYASKFAVESAAVVLAGNAVRALARRLQLIKADQGASRHGSVHFTRILDERASELMALKPRQVGGVQYLHQVVVRRRAVPARRSGAQAAAKQDAFGGRNRTGGGRNRTGRSRAIDRG